MPKEKRVETLRNFRQEKLMVLTNVGVLTEGFDDPGVSCILWPDPQNQKDCMRNALEEERDFIPAKKIVLFDRVGFYLILSCKPFLLCLDCQKRSI